MPSPTPFAYDDFVPALAVFVVALFPSPPLVEDAAGTGVGVDFASPSFGAGVLR